MPPYYDKIQKFFKFKKPCLKSIQLHAVNLTVAFYVTNLYFLLSEVK